MHFVALILLVLRRQTSQEFCVSLLDHREDMLIAADRKDLVGARRTRQTRSDETK